MDAGFTTKDGRDAFESFRIFVESVTPQAEDLQKAGDWLVDKRRQETLGGRDVEGNGFAPYSPNYALRVGTSVPSLYSRTTGPHMLDHLEAHTVSETDGTISLEVGIFGDPELAERARVQNEGATIRTRLGMGHEGFKQPLNVGRKQQRGKALLEIPERRWLGASDQDLLTMAGIISESIDERVKKNG